jgi:hypothetical protein
MEPILKPSINPDINPIINPYTYAYGLDIDFDNVITCISKRLINRNYTGYCMQVIRASDSQTKDIEFVNGLVDQDTLEEFCAGTDGYVNIMYDQAGNYNWSQSNSANRPLIVSSGTMNTNFIYFDGAADPNGDVLENNDNILSEFGLKFTSYFRINPDASPNNWNVVYTLKQAAGTGFWCEQNAAEAYGYTFNANCATSDKYTALKKAGINTANQTYTFTRNDTVAKGFYDGVLYETDSAFAEGNVDQGGTLSQIGNDFLSGSGAYKGYLSEFILFNLDIDQETINRLHDNTDF